MEGKKTKKVFEFEDGSVYYGDIAYLDESKKIIDPEKLSGEQDIEKLQKVRHGKGVQLYGKNADSTFSCYEGEWAYDMKNGKGILIFADQSKYEGEFCNEQMEGKGVYFWNNGDCYEGGMGKRKDGRRGEFKSAANFKLKGLFLNNKYYDERYK